MVALDNLGEGDVRDASVDERNHAPPAAFFDSLDRAAAHHRRENPIEGAGVAAALQVSQDGRASLHLGALRDLLRDLLPDTAEVHAAAAWHGGPGGVAADRRRSLG